MPRLSKQAREDLETRYYFDASPTRATQRKAALAAVVSAWLRLKGQCESANASCELERAYNRARKQEQGHRDFCDGLGKAISGRARVYHASVGDCGKQLVLSWVHRWTEDHSIAPGSAPGFAETLELCELLLVKGIDPAPIESAWVTYSVLVGQGRD